MLIRDATPADAAAIAKIYNHYIRKTTASFEEEPVDEALVRGRLAAVQDAGLPWLVAGVVRPARAPPSVPRSARPET